MRVVIVPLVVALALVLPAPVRAAETPAQPAGWIGIFLDGPDDPTAEADGAETVARGVRVRGVVEGAPADRAHIRASDRILAVDGAAVATPSELMSRLRTIEPGSSVTFTMLRRGKEMEVGTRLGVRPPSTEGLRPVIGWIGIEAIPLPPSLREHFGAPETAGILVSAVAAGSPAEAAGIRIGDVVYEVNGAPVASSGQLGRFVSEAGVDNPAELVLARDGARIVVEPRVQRKPATGS